MSVEAMSWALNQYVEDAGAKVVLIALANHADRFGARAFPSQESLAHYACCSVRTVRRKLALLRAAGLIRPGTADEMVYIRADRRPLVWTLAMADEPPAPPPAPRPPADIAPPTRARTYPPHWTSSTGRSSTPRSSTPRSSTPVDPEPAASSSTPVDQPAASSSTSSTSSTPVDPEPASWAASTTGQARPVAADRSSPLRPVTGGRTTGHLVSDKPSFNQTPPTPPVCAQHQRSRCWARKCRADQAQQLDRSRQLAAVERRRADLAARRAAVDGCPLCDDAGRARNGLLCDHDAAAADRAHRGAQLAAAALAAARDRGQHRAPWSAQRAPQLAGVW